MTYRVDAPGRDTAWHATEAEAIDRDACGKCGREVVQVDLTGTPFFTHKPRRDCLTWWHVDQQRNLSHQAVPTYEGDA